MSLGEDRVRYKFNPGENAIVTTIKQKTAELIDLCEDRKERASASIKMDNAVIADNSEKNRCFALAQTYYETAAMYAVKAATA